MCRCGRRKPSWFKADAFQRERRRFYCRDRCPCRGRYDVDTPEHALAVAEARLADLEHATAWRERYAELGQVRYQWAVQDAQALLRKARARMEDGDSWLADHRAEVKRQRRRVAGLRRRAG